MDKLSTATVYNLATEDEVVRFIPTGFTDGNERLFYVIKESPYTALWPGSVVSTDVLSDTEIETVFGIKLPIKSMPISRTIKATPNDWELGTAMRKQQVSLEQNNPTIKFDKYGK